MATQSLESYYSAIRDAIANNDFSSVVDTARSGLTDYPKEAEFAKIEVVALIKQESPTQALAAIAKARSTKLAAGKALEFEAAYCHFTLGSYEEASKALKRAEQGPAVTHLKAQIAYKLDSFVECISLYESLIASAEEGSEEYQELLLNLTAAKAAAAQADQGKSNGSSGRPSAAAAAQEGGYELMFNSATDLLARNRAQEAADILGRAIAQAKSSLAEQGWSPQDIQAEVAAIEAQRAVALQQLGKTDEARSIYSQLLSGTALDSAAREVVSHNAAATCVPECSRRGIGLTSIKRALQIRSSASHSLSRSQRALMTYNMAAIQLSQGQYVAARRSLARLGKLFSNVIVPNAGIVSACISLHTGNAQGALDELAALSRALAPEEGVHTTLAAAQVAIGLGDNRRAADILETWSDRAKNVPLQSVLEPAKFIYYLFGVGVLVDWLASGGNGAPSVPADAAKRLKSELDKVQSPSASLLIAVGDCFAFAGDLEQAKAYFSQASKAALDSGLAVDKLASAHMRAILASDGSKQSVAQLLKGYTKRGRVLRAVPGVSARFTRQFLPRSNAAGRSAAPRRSDIPTAPVSGRSKNKSEKYRARRQRRLLKRPPKGYDSEHKPDSERWLPLRQRSYYRPRGRNRRQQKLRGGAQGGATEAGAGLGGTGSSRIAGYVADAAGAQADAAGAQADAESSSAQQQPSSNPSKSKTKAGKGKAKKGKGKKGW